jgi:hypothetical protein
MPFSGRHVVKITRATASQPSASICSDVFQIPLF